MSVPPRSDVYSAAEIALAAGVPEGEVVALVGRRRYVPYVGRGGRAASTSIERRRAAKTARGASG